MIAQFLRSFFQGLKIQVHVCKLLIILDYLNGRVPEESILKLIQVMFKSMIEAFSASDSILLRHVVEFFLDVLKQSAQAQIVASYQNYEIDVENLLNVSFFDIASSAALNAVVFSRRWRTTFHRTTVTTNRTIPNACLFFSNLCIA